MTSRGARERGANDCLDPNFQAGVFEDAIPGSARHNYNLLLMKLRVLVGRLVPREFAFVISKHPNISAALKLNNLPFGVSFTDEDYSLKTQIANATLQATTGDELIAAANDPFLNQLVNNIAGLPQPAAALQNLQLIPNEFDEQINLVPPPPPPAAQVAAQPPVHAAPSEANEQL